MTRASVLHTPGPFDLNGEGVVVATVGSRRAGQIEVTAPLTSSHKPVPPEEVQANAHLFKAAPDMLRLLERIEASDGDDRISWTMRQVREQIAQARGQQS